MQKRVRSRAGAATSLLLGLVVLLPPSASAAPANFAHGTIEQTLTTTRPNAPTGFHFVGSYHAAGDPDAPPPYMRKMTAYGGPRRDTSVPGRCTASDLELAVSGAAACPAGSRLGAGTSKGIFMDSFPTTVKLDVFNNTGEQIMVVRSPVVSTVSRGRIRPDGSIEFASPTCYPAQAGCPVDNSLQLRSDITVPPYTTTRNGRVRSYLTTPSTCPKSGHWTTTIRLWWADGSDDTARIRQPCEAPKAQRPKAKQRKPRVKRCGTFTSTNSHGAGGTLRAKAVRLRCRTARRVLKTFFRRGGTADDKPRIKGWSCRNLHRWEPGRSAYRCRWKKNRARVAIAYWTRDGE